MRSWAISHDLIHHWGLYIDQYGRRGGYPTSPQILVVMVVGIRRSEVSLLLFVVVVRDRLFGSQRDLTRSGGTDRYLIPTYDRLGDYLQRTDLRDR